MTEISFDIMASLETDISWVSATRLDRKDGSRAGETWPITSAPSLLGVSRVGKTRTATGYLQRRTYAAYDTTLISTKPKKINLSCSLQDESPVASGELRGSRRMSLYKIPSFYSDAWPDLSSCLLLKTFDTIPPPSLTLVYYAYYFDLPGESIELLGTTYFALTLLDETTQPYWWGPTCADFRATLGGLKLAYEEE